MSKKTYNKIIDSINKFQLTTIVDKINPIGSIMAGHSGVDYKEIKRLKKERREAKELLLDNNND